VATWHAAGEKIIAASGGADGDYVRVEAVRFTHTKQHIYLLRRFTRDTDKVPK